MDAKSLVTAHIIILTEETFAFQWAKLPHDVAIFLRNARKNVLEQSFQADFQSFGIQSPSVHVRQASHQNGQKMGTTRSVMTKAKTLRGKPTLTKSANR